MQKSHIYHFDVQSAMIKHIHSIWFFFFFNDTATTEIYTLSLHDALPIFELPEQHRALALLRERRGQPRRAAHRHIPLRGELRDRKSTRLNSSHSQISYAVFCLKKKINYTRNTHSNST